MRCLAVPRWRVRECSVYLEEPRDVDGLRTTDSILSQSKPRFVSCYAWYAML
jgi:hypothetical protein